MPAEDQLIACMDKNSVEAIHVTLCKFKGVNLIDVRTFVNYAGTPDEKPKATKKGISLRLERLPELLEALKAAFDTARAQGRVDADQELAA
jgi:hypothetical protein